MAAKATACASLLVLSGCGGAAGNSETKAGPVSRGAVSPQTYAGDLRLRVADSFSTKDGTNLPVSLYLGLFSETETRLGINAFLDLRDIQRALPELLTGKIEADCGIDLDITFEGAEAEGEFVRARGTVKATLYRCHGRDTEEERRGFRLLSQTIDVEARATASLERDCVNVRLDDLQLEPRGLVGGMANLFGLTERARTAILSAGETKLSENPICPDMPIALERLDPDFSEGGLREIDEGGLGAALSGSVDLNAENVVEILALAQARGSPPGPSKTLQPPASGPGVSYRIDETLKALETEIPYGLDLSLYAAAPTRLGTEAQLDLRRLQTQLPDLLADTVLFDSCGSRVTLHGVEAEASGTSLIATGPLELESFDCERTAPGTWQRGAASGNDYGTVRFEASTDLDENCVVFRLLGVERDPPLPLAETEDESGRPQAIRALLLEAIGLMLEHRPLCPVLPPAIELLDPHFTRGTPQEIGEGGVGIALDGSIDISTTTLIQLLGLFQQRGLLPPSP